MAIKVTIWVMMLFMLVASVAANACVQYGNHYYCATMPNQTEINDLDNDLGIEINNITFVGTNSSTVAVAGQSFNITVDWDSYVKINNGMNITGGQGANGVFSSSSITEKGSAGGSVIFNVTAPKIDVAGNIYAKGGRAGNGSCSSSTESCDGDGGTGGNIYLLFNSTNTNINVTGITKINLTGGISGNGDADSDCGTDDSDTARGDAQKGGSVTFLMSNAVFDGITINALAGDGSSAATAACTTGTSGDSSDAASGRSDGDITFTFGNVTLNNTNLTWNYGARGSGDATCHDGTDSGSSDGDNGEPGGARTLTMQNALFNNSRINIYTQKGTDGIACATGDGYDEEDGGNGGLIRLTYSNLESNNSLINLVTGTGGAPDYEGSTHQGDGGDTGYIYMAGNLTLGTSQNVTLATMASAAETGAYEAINYRLTGGSFKLNNGSISFMVQTSGAGTTDTYYSGSRGSTLYFVYDNVTLLKNFSFKAGNATLATSRANAGGDVTFTANKYFYADNATQLNLTAGNVPPIGSVAPSGTHAGHGGRTLVTLGGNITLNNISMNISAGSGLAGIFVGGGNATGNTLLTIKNITSWNSSGAKINLTCNNYNTSVLCDYYNVSMNGTRNVELFGSFRLANDSKSSTKLYDMSVIGNSANRTWVGLENFNTTGVTLTVYAPNISTNTSDSIHNFFYYQINSSTIAFNKTGTNQTMPQFMSRVYTTTLSTDTPLLYNFSTYNCSVDYAVYNASVEMNYTIVNNGTAVTCNATVTDNSTINSNLSHTLVFVDPYPYNLTIKSGNYTYWGAHDFAHDGNMNHSEQISLEVGNINHYIQNYCNATTCLVPIMIETLTPSSINITAINITYGTDNITPNNFSLITRIYSDSEGLLNLTDPQFTYESDEQTTLRVRTYYQEPGMAKVYSPDRYISVLYSEFNLTLPHGNTYYDVYPLYTGQQAVQPWGQTKTVPVWNVTTNRSHKFEIKARYDPGTYEACVPTYWSINNNALSRTGDIQMNESYKALFNVTNNTNKIWAFHDFTANCTWDDLRMYFPNFTFTALCDGCVCTQDLKNVSFCTT